MNIDVLNFIAGHAREKLVFIARNNKLNPDTCLETIDEIISHKGNISTLTDEQQKYFISIIEPLVDDGFCEGAKHYFTTGNKCNGDVYIDDGCLSQCYMDENYICHTCNYDEKN
jgi:hypothetical protein